VRAEVNCTLSETDSMGAEIILRYFQRFAVLCLTTHSVARLPRFEWRDER
jgi:hypothetical protein